MRAASLTLDALLAATDCPETASEELLSKALVSALPQQREMIASKSRKKAALAGRRAGKTMGACLGLIEAGTRNPNTILPYLCLTKTSARYIAWPVLHKVEREYSLGMRMNESTLVARLPSGSQIVLCGADDPKDMNRLRGAPYPRVVVDEAGHFPRGELAYLVDEVLEPATLDFRGDIWLIGTTNPACQGYFYDITTGSGGMKAWPTWRWTALENHHLPHAREEIERMMAERSWDWNSPVVQREWLAKWIRDESGLVFRFVREKHVQTPPSDIVHRVLGVDLGTSETKPTTAFVLLGYPSEGRAVWCLEAEKRAAMGPDEIAQRILSYQDQGLDAVVVDPGGLGGGFVKIFRERYGIACTDAKKAEKLATIELLNGDLDGKRLLFAPESRALIDEIEILPWNEKRTGPRDGAPDHCCDAMLYAWRETYAYTQATAGKAAPEPGTPEHYAAKAQELREQAAREAKKRRNREWWMPT